MSIISPNSHRSMGICLGASTITTVELIDGKARPVRIPHGGQVGDTVKNIILEAVPTRLGITGRKFRNLMNIKTVSEPEAIELAYNRIKDNYPPADCILSAGSESFLLYALDKRGRVKTVNAGSKCASGTGEFFLQQIKRMQLGIKDAVNIAASSVPYDIAARCSVFSKSDCTHALNKGVGKGHVAAGLCRMMAVKMVELLKAAKVKSVMVVGGVSQNKVVMSYLKEAFPECRIPEEAPYFEALGAMLWAEQNESITDVKDDLVKPSFHSFPILPDLKTGAAKVEFKISPEASFYDGEYIVGLDVGSTTTKAVLMRTDNKAIVASEYLRTLGDPVKATRQCYQALLDQVPQDTKLNIAGLGATGSGRQLAGLHALTSEIINEIMAHAAAAVHFDPDVDTVFEIGGQDAKYTYITNGVPTDYAMNEACSAGTGSFLEEACQESFQIDTLDIAKVALSATAPPNFSDQCAAFIGSDIKTAVQEGSTIEDSVAGLVYSVCQNYLNRVKGNRPAGKKIFMQGGVCYNNAVPLAMAILCGQEIIVPPEPGLMGAFGTALEVHRRIEAGIISRQRFGLGELAEREIRPEKPFICAGGKDKCDRKCSIDRYRINDKVYPFGGACNMYNNLNGKSSSSTDELDLVRVREGLVFNGYPPAVNGDSHRTIGLPVSLYTNTAYPLYSHFFSSLGLKVISSGEPAPEGFEAAGSSFCFPVMQSHGILKDLLSKDPDHIFLPQVKYAYIKTSDDPNCTCPFIQGEPYYLRAAFHDDLAHRMLTEVLDFSSRNKLQKSFINIGRKLGFGFRRSVEAFDAAWEVFLAMDRKMKDEGRLFLSSIEPDETSIVLFGRSYNAFTGLGNMGIPQKFTSRGHGIVPYDFLPLDELGGSTVRRMYWASGQGILQAAEYVREQPNLFGVYITNFSCGPDSFIAERFKTIMGNKPFLTLELDDHTADAGIDTRVEAFLDVVKGYREVNVRREEKNKFIPSKTFVHQDRFMVKTADGRDLSITDPRVHVLFPSMGDTGARAMAAASRYVGIRATAVKEPGRLELDLGKGETSCKECLPFILTAGSLLRYLEERVESDEVLTYFMPEADGPCRFGQYGIALNEMIRKKRLKNVAVISLSSENGYSGMPPGWTSRAILAFIIADGLDDLHAGILALAEDKKRTLKAYNESRERILCALDSRGTNTVMSILKKEMEKLALFRKSKSIKDATKITLTGEIYVRKDRFSRQYLVEKLASKGIVVMTSPISEWFQYIVEYVAKGISTSASPRQRLTARIKSIMIRRREARTQNLFRLSGFYDGHRVDMGYLLEKGSSIIDPRFTGESILTVASTLKEIGDDTHGVISIGPFGCMPARVAESILTHRLQEEKQNFSKRNSDFWARYTDELSLPFLAIETDGNTFPQLVEARLESLVLSANRLKAELSTAEGFRPS